MIFKYFQTALFCVRVPEFWLERMSSKSGVQLCTVTNAEKLMHKAASVDLCSKICQILYITKDKTKMYPKS